MGASQIDEGITFNVAGGLMLEHPLTLPFVDAVVSYLTFQQHIHSQKKHMHAHWNMILMELLASNPLIISITFNTFFIGRNYRGIVIFCSCISTTSKYLHLYLSLIFSISVPIKLIFWCGFVPLVFLNKMSCDACGRLARLIQWWDFPKLLLRNSSWKLNSWRHNTVTIFQEIPGAGSRRKLLQLYSEVLFDQFL